MAEDDDGIFIMKRVFIGKELVKGREQVTADIAAGVEFLLGKKSREINIKPSHISYGNFYGDCASNNRFNIHVRGRLAAVDREDPGKQGAALCNLRQAQGNSVGVLHVTVRRKLTDGFYLHTHALDFSVNRTQHVKK